MGSKSSPPPPDYRGAAEEQAQASQELATQQTYANRPEQITPFGSVSYGTRAGVDPATGRPVTQWTQTTALTPELQRALEAQQGLTTGRSELAGSMLDRVRGEFGESPDYSQLHEKGGDVRGVAGAGAYTGRAGEALAQAFESRMGPQFQRDEAQLDTTLRNRGLSPGDEAYDQALADLRMSQSDQRNQMMARAQAMNAEEAERLQGMDVTRMRSALDTSAYANQQRQRDIAEMLQQRGWSLNEINALISGEQVNMPQAPSFMGASAGQAPQYLAAAGQRGQYDLAAQQQENQMFSDILGAVTSPFSFGWGA